MFEALLEATSIDSLVLDPLKALPIREAVRVRPSIADQLSLRGDLDSESLSLELPIAEVAFLVDLLA